jgi:hypothetical protein
LSLLEKKNGSKIFFYLSTFFPQVVTEALSSTSKLPPFCQIEIKREDQTVVEHDFTTTTPTANDNEDFEEELDLDNEDDEEEVAVQPTTQHPHYHSVTLQQQQQLHSHPNLIGKTIVASDNDVTNGFVKDGKMLPYVFEANESGKKILSFEFQITNGFIISSNKQLS